MKEKLNKEIYRRYFGTIKSQTENDTILSQCAIFSRGLELAFWIGAHSLIQLD